RRLKTIWEEVEGLRRLQEANEHHRCFIEEGGVKRVEQYKDLGPELYRVNSRREVKMEGRE
ncbi:MAG: hypothetical protein L0Y56_12945, partial [Nitrospira sp.]|nr:hypothetical protein [Nitrospira sp.]